MRRTTLKAGIAVLTLWAGLLAAGCSTQARRVDCEGRLRPINVPAPVVSAPAPSVSSGDAAR